MSMSKIGSILVNFQAMSSISGKGPGPGPGQGWARAKAGARAGHGGEGSDGTLAHIAAERIDDL